jgi:dethiobiotin synthetase
MGGRSATRRSIATMHGLTGFYVTGTDTGIGKTHASSALLHALRARGLRAVGMKPVASGCERTTDGWRNEDALALQAASDPRPAYDDVNPFALPQPLAPQLAARDAGIDIRLDVLLAAHARLAAQADCVVVEGVGGWAAPLSDTLLQAELARAFALPVVLVVGLRLGCLNHAFLSARAIADDGLQLVGWIGNAIDPDMARRDDNLALLAAGLPAPCWGVLPHAPEGNAADASRCLRMPDAILRLR